jgi:cyanuric acid amidohydrolase
MQALAFLVPTRSPSDVSGVAELLDTGAIRVEEIVAVLGKTEGNGGRNDFTRELCTSALATLLAPRLGVAPRELEDRVVLSLSGGTEGVVAPHLVVLGVRREGAVAPVSGQQRLAVGVGATRAFAPEEIGRMPQILETARAIRAIASDMGLASLEDVHLVQMKGAIPEASYEAIEAAKRAGAPLRNDMVHSRAASALGAALATGEVREEDLSDDVVCARWDLYSSVASCSAKPKLERTEIMILANSPAWGGDLVVEHGVLEDILDARGVERVLEKLGLPGRPGPEDRARIVGVFAKSEADPRRTIRGRRHVMLDDDDVSDTRYSRCALAAVIASVVGDGCVYVSTRAEHHGPLGGGPLAVLARVSGRPD